jgi:VWFA-related protein
MINRRLNCPRTRMCPPRGVAAALFAAVICICFVAQALAQSGKVRDNQTKPDDDTIRLKAEEVLITVNVQSTSGKLANQLAASDLIVVEDSQRRAITSISRTPANIVFIVDSCIEYTKFKQINLNRDFAMHLIDSLGDGDHAAIITYAGKVQLLSGWTSDKAALREALTEKFKPGVKSHLYDSLVYAAQELFPKTSGRRSIVLLTDGYDDFPKDVLNQAREAIDRSRATVYCIDQSWLIRKDLGPVAHRKSLSELMSQGMDPKYREQVANERRYMEAIEAEEKTMQSLAEDTGGAFWNLGAANEFKPAETALITDIGSEYVVSYLSERKAGDAALHELKVYPSRMGLAIKSRRGVYSSLQ